MNERNNFLGLNGFIWWVGVIVNREDNLQVGRCKVRIFGWHTDDKKLLPDEDLPWAMPLYPPNNSKSFESPKVDDWIFGFFMDGESAQFPVYFGVFPYIVPNKITDDNGFNPEPEAGAPKSPYGIPQPGQSNLPLLAQGQYLNSGIQTADEDRIHVCDIRVKANFDAALAKLKSLVDVEAIRAAAAEAWAATASSPLAENVSEVAKSVKAQAKLIKQYTDTITEEAKALQEYQQYLENLIKTIESLPAEAQKMFAECLSGAKTEMQSLNEMQSITGK